MECIAIVSVLRLDIAIQHYYKYGKGYVGDISYSVTIFLQELYNVLVLQIYARRIIVHLRFSTTSLRCLKNLLA